MRGYGEVPPIRMLRAYLKKQGLNTPDEVEAKELSLKILKEIKI